MPQNEVRCNVRLPNTWVERVDKFVRRFKRLYLPISKKKIAQFHLGPRKGGENSSSSYAFYLPCSLKLGKPNICLLRHSVLKKSQATDLFFLVVCISFVHLQSVSFLSPELESRRFLMPFFWLLCFSFLPVSVVVTFIPHSEILHLFVSSLRFEMSVSHRSFC